MPETIEDHAAPGAPGAPRWREDEVKARLEEAAETLRALSLTIRDKPAKVAARWPDVVRDTWEAYGYSAVRVRPPAPPPARISRADEAVGWLLWLPDAERRIAWARACRIPWRRLEDLDGRSHTTLRKVQAGALMRICRKLNAAVSAGDGGAERARNFPLDVPWLRPCRFESCRPHQFVGTPPSSRRENR